MCFVILLFISGTLYGMQEPVQVSIVPATQRKKTEILFVHQGSCDQLMKVVGSYLERTGQCAVTCRVGELPVHKRDIEQLFNAGFPFVCFVALSQDKQFLNGRLYDASDQAMMQGKRWARRDPLGQWAQKIAQDLWMQVTGQRGSFGSSLAYVKKEKGNCSLCIVSWPAGVGPGGAERVIRSGKTLMVAPAFKPDGKLLFFSEFTNRNVRLRAADMKGRCWTVIDADGTCVGVSGLPGFDEVIYGRSGDIWRYRYDTSKRRGSHELLIEQGGDCACPNLLSSGNIVYCAQGKVWSWSPLTKQSTVLSKPGYAAGPSVHERSGQIVYSKRCNRIMQLFLYSLKQGTERQLTFDKGDKLDPSFSPCGLLVTYALVVGARSDIMVINTINGVTERISSGGYCSCPTWAMAAE